MTLDEQAIYSIGAVERMVGIPAATLRNWEERYGLITPERSAGGQRLYTRRQVEQLQFLKREVAGGLQPAEAHRLLAEHEPSNRPGPGGDEGPQGARPLILLAERDPYAAELAEFFLRREGYEVVLALDAHAAQRACMERRPDLAVVELTISGGAGPELCTRLKERGVPACLAVSSLDAEEEALASGADAFLPKPFEPPQLLSTVNDLLGRTALLSQPAARTA